MASDNNSYAILSNYTSQGLQDKVKAHIASKGASVTRMIYDMQSDVPPYCKPESRDDYVILTLTQSKDHLYRAIMDEDTNTYMKMFEEYDTKEGSFPEYNTLDAAAAMMMRPEIGKLFIDTFGVDNNEVFEGMIMLTFENPEYLTYVNDIVPLNDVLDTVIKAANKVDDPEDHYTNIFFLMRWTEKLNEHIDRDVRIVICPRDFRAKIVAPEPYYQCESASQDV